MLHIRTRDQKKAKSYFLLLAMHPTSSPDEVCYDSTYAAGDSSQERSPSPAYSIGQRQREIAQVVSKNQPHKVEPLPNHERELDL